jgi:HSP20 family protein
MTMMTRFDPSNTIVSFREAMDQLVRDSFVAPFGLFAQGANVMPIDIYEGADSFVVRAFMPGLTPEDLEIHVQERTVTIQGEARTEEVDGLRPLLQERAPGRFTRTFTLPVPVQANQVNAELVNGVLNLTLPKSEGARPRRIQVRSS